MHNLFVPPLPKYKDAHSKAPKSSFLKKSTAISQTKEEDLTVSNLRQLYSSLLEEMAPLHAEMGTGLHSADMGSSSNIRWKNSGIITIQGDDDEGYDYAYTPDNSKKSWRLGSSSATTGGNMCGVTGGDWSKDGVSRYYTGGNIARGGLRRVDESANKKDQVILSIGSMDVDISTMNGVGVSPQGSSTKKDDVRDDGVQEKVNKEEDEEALFDVNILDSPTASLEDITLGATTPITSADNGSSSFRNLKKAFDSNNRVNNSNMTTFESLFHIHPTTAWRLRSAYAPTTPQEQDLLLSASEELAHRHPEKTEAIAKGLELAKTCEERVCDGLWRVGELICLCEKMKNKGEPDSSDDDDDNIEAAEAVFAYFCEKNILPMFIDAILCRPPPLSSSSTFDSSPSPFSGCTWTSSVKAQILQIIAMLLVNTTSPLSLTYLLSNNYMNELVMGMLPLDQWKKEALEELIPPYVTLLRGLVMKLKGNEGCFCTPLLMCQRQRTRGSGRNDEGDSSTEAYFPIFYAATQVLVSNLGSTLRDGDGCLVKSTAMNAILNLCRVTEPEVRDVLVSGLDPGSESELPSTKSQAAFLKKDAHLTVEQELVFPYICNSLKACYNRSVRLLMIALQHNNPNNHQTQQIPEYELDAAKEEAASRHQDIASGLLSELRYWLGFLDDLLSCDIRNWNVRLCEYIMRDVIVDTVLLNWNRSLESLETDSSSKLSLMKKSEELLAKAQIRASVNFITQVMGMVEYRPLLRMVAAALLHEKYPREWYSHDGIGLINGTDSFVVTPILHTMVTSRNSQEADAGAGVVIAQDELHSSLDQGDRQAAAEFNHNEQQQEESLYTSNRCRSSLLKMLTEQSQPAEVTSSACMLCAAILENDALDDIVLGILGVLPSSGSSDFENAIATYLEGFIRTHESNSSASCQSAQVAAVEYISSLGSMLLERMVYHVWTQDGKCLDEAPFNHYYSSSRFISALQSVLRYLSTFALKLSKADITNDLFADYMEAEIRRRFLSNTDQMSPKSQDSNIATYTCCLSDFNPSNFIDLTSGSSPTLLASNSGRELEPSHFVSKLVLHLRSLLVCVQEFHSRFTSLSGPRLISNKRWRDEEEALSFCMHEQADDSIIAIGSLQLNPLPRAGTQIDLRGRTVFRDGFEHKPKLTFVDASVMSLILVIDPEEIYVCRQLRACDSNLCVVHEVILIRNVIASATEKSLLHIALRHPDQDKPYSDLVKGGKLTLDFKTMEKSTIVKDCLDKYCLAYKTRKAFEIEDFLEKCCQMCAKNSSEETSGETWTDFQQG